MKHTIEFIDLRSTRRIPCESLMVNYSDKEEAEREAAIAAMAKTFQMGKRVAARVVPA